MAAVAGVWSVESLLPLMRPVWAARLPAVQKACRPPLTSLTAPQTSSSSGSVPVWPSSGTFFGTPTKTTRYERRLKYVIYSRSVFDLTGNTTQFMILFPPSRLWSKFACMSHAVQNPAGMRKTSPLKSEGISTVGQDFFRQFHPSPNASRQSLCRVCAQMNWGRVKSVNERAEGRLSPLAVLAPPFADSAQFPNYGSL